MKNDAKLKGKDLINVGIYAAIYCVIMTAVAMLGFIPIMMPMLCVLVPLLGGIPMMLFMTKVKKIWNDYDLFHNRRTVPVGYRNGILAVYLWNCIRFHCRPDCKER